MKENRGRAYPTQEVTRLGALFRKAMDPNGPALTPAERRLLSQAPPKPDRAHADVPGSGPEGETCGTCSNLYRNRLSKTYLKCGLMRSYWTGGAGTDVRAKDAACSHWAPQ